MSQILVINMVRVVGSKPHTNSSAPLPPPPIPELEFEKERNM